MDRARLARHLVRAALAYHDAELWRRWSGNQLVAIHVPGQPHPVFATFFGDGANRGLNVCRGPDGLRDFRAVIHAPDDDMAEASMDSLAVLFGSPSDLRPAYETILREAKFSGGLAPLFVARSPGREPRPTNRADNELLLAVLEGILAANARGLLHMVEPPAQGRAAVWTLRLSGKPTAPEVQARFEEYAADGVAAPKGAVVPEEVRGLTRTGSSWWIAAPVLPAQLQTGERELRAVIVFDATENALLALRVGFDIGPAEVAEAFVAACRVGDYDGEPGLPAHVDFDEEWARTAMADALTEAGVASACVGRIEEAEMILEDFLANGDREDSYQDDDGNEDEEPEVDAVGMDEVPEPDDLAAWKALDETLSIALAKIALMETIPDEATRRYFGPEPGLERDSPAACACFAEWFTCHRRQAQGKPSLADRLLADDSLADGLQALLIARASAEVGLYRIAAVHRGIGVDLEDVLQGGRVRVADRSLSETARPGIVLFGKLYPAGQFTFMAGLSAPLLEPTAVTLQWLEAQGLELTAAGLQQQSHLLGRLWAYRAAAGAPQLCNTDGEDLMDIRASFAVTDADALRRALLLRPDVETDADSGGPWLWFRTKHDGSRQLLGRLEFTGDELVASVNSEARWARLQEWLARMDGVRLSSVTRQLLSLPMNDRLRDGGKEQREPPREETLREPGLARERDLEQDG